MRISKRLWDADIRSAYENLEGNLEVLYLISLWDNLDEFSSSYVNFFSSLLTFSPPRARIGSLRSQESEP